MQRHGIGSRTASRALGLPRTIMPGWTLMRWPGSSALRRGGRRRSTGPRWSRRWGCGCRPTFITFASAYGPITLGEFVWVWSPVGAAAQLDYGTHRMLRAWRDRDAPGHPYTFWPEAGWVSGDVLRERAGLASAGAADDRRAGCVGGRWSRSAAGTGSRSPARPVRTEPAHRRDGRTDRCAAAAGGGDTRRRRAHRRRDRRGPAGPARGPVGRATAQRLPGVDRPHRRRHPRPPVDPARTERAPGLRPDRRAHPDRPYPSGPRRGMPPAGWAEAVGPVHHRRNLLVATGLVRL